MKTQNTTDKVTIVTVSITDLQHTQYGSPDIIDIIRRGTEGSQNKVRGIRGKKNCRRQRPDKEAAVKFFCENLTLQNISF